MIEYLMLFKSLHIIGAVAWFGGLFYLVRIFVYHVEALDKSGREREVLTHQFGIMEDKAYRIICIPGMLVTWIFGSMMIAAYMDTQGMDWLKSNSWFHVKFLLVILLSGYQHYCKSYIKKLKQGIKPLNSFRMRLANEVPTLFLVAIVLLAVYRNTLNSMIAIVGMLIFGVVLFLFTKWYKSKRTKSS